MRFYSIVYRWRGAPSHAATAHARHPGRRQLPWNPRDEAASGGGHEEASISGTQLRNHTTVYFLNSDLLLLDVLSK